MGRFALFRCCISVSLLVSCAYNPQDTESIQPERSSSSGASALTLEGRNSQALKAAGKSVSGKEWMISAAHPLAVEVGAKILKNGGTAADAAIATQAVLGLVEPQSSGLGGGGFVVWYDAASGEVTTLDGREVSPSLATEQLFMQSDGDSVAFYEAVIGGKSVGVPSMVRLMEAVHVRWGKESFASLFDDAIHYAESGFEVSKRLAALIAYDEERLRLSVATSDYFLPSGGALRAGQMLKNKPYADTLRKVAQGGAAAFYYGDMARDIVEAVRGHSNAGLLSVDDLHDYKVVERAPICGNYHNYTVCGMPPPSSGGIALIQALSMVEPYELSKMNAYSPRAWRLIADATRLAFADRAVHVADPDVEDVPADALIDGEYLKNRSLLLKHHVPLEDVSAGDFENNMSAGISVALPSTSHLSIVDSYGNALSMTSSIENAFGSRVMVGGFLLNNQLTDFAFDPVKNGKQVLNRVRGGKRPMSSMSPMIVLRDDRPYLVVGSPGGSRIIGYVLQSLVAMLDWGMTPQQAADMPRLVNRYGVYDIENVGEVNALSLALGAMGYDVKRQSLTSGLHAVMVGEGVLLGGADSRREGIAIGQ